MPLSLIKFNLRFRLALDFNVSISGNYSNVKQPEIAEVYQKTYKLTELWNSYEAFLHFCKDINNCTKKCTKDSPFFESFFNNSGLNEVLDIFRNKFIELCKNNPDGCNAYLDKIMESSAISKDLKDKVQTIRNEIANNHRFPSRYMLSLLYSERNMYFHSGQTADSGFKFSVRSSLLDIYIELLIKVLITSYCHVMKLEIEKRI